MCIFGIRNSFGTKSQNEAREECKAVVPESDLISVTTNRIQELLVNLLADAVTSIRTSAGQNLRSDLVTSHIVSYLNNIFHCAQLVYIMALK